MSFNSPKLDFTVEASVDLSANQFQAVRIVAAGAEVAATLDGNIVGILQNNPDAAGQAAVVQNKGVAQAQVGAAVTRGVRLVVDANGDLIPIGANANPVATALEAGSGANSIIAVLLD